MFKSKLFYMLIGGLPFGGISDFGNDAVPTEAGPGKRRFRSRIPGPAGKPGDKLARLAARRRIGLSTIR